MQHLEWQVRTELRRTQRFAGPASARPFAALRSAALVIASLALGAAGVLASERIQGSREKALHVARAELELDLARARLERAAKAARRAEELVRHGVASSSATAEAEARLLAARLELQRRELERAEVLASGRGPRDELGAPLVAGRDFVAERLALDVAGARALSAALTGELERRRQLFEAGLMGRSELDRAELERTLLERALAAKEGLRTLRGSFARGEIERVHIEILAARIEAVERLEAARASLAFERRRAEEVRAAGEAGLASNEETSAARAALAEAEARALLAESELALIDERLGR